MRPARATTGGRGAVAARRRRPLMAERVRLSRQRRRLAGRMNQPHNVVRQVVGRLQRRRARQVERDAPTDLQVLRQQLLHPPRASPFIIFIKG